MAKRARKMSKEKPYNHPHYLKGSIFCGQCGTRLGATKIRKPDGMEYDYFYCLGRQKRQSCSQKYVAMDKIEDAVEALWESIELPATQVEAIRGAVLEFVRDSSAAQHGEQQRQRARLKTLDAERNELMEAYYANAIPVNILKREQQRLGQEMRACQVVLDSAEEDLAEVERGLQDVLTLVADCGQLYRQADHQIRRQLNQAVFEKILIDHDEVGGFYFRQPFKQLVGPTMELEREVDAELGRREERRYLRRSQLRPRRDRAGTSEDLWAWRRGDREQSPLRAFDARL